MDGSTEDLQTFCALLPKVELHAHLTGSVSVSTLSKQLSLKGRTHIKVREWEAASSNRRTKDETFHMFQQLHDLMDDASCLRDITSDVINEFCDDNVKYLELRTTPRSTMSGLTKLMYIETIIDSIANFDGDCIVKLLISINIKLGFAEAAENVDLALRYMAGGVVVGLDLSGDPMCDAALYLPLLEKAKHGGLKITAHLAEMFTDHLLEDVTAILSLPPDRIGHGSLLHKLGVGVSDSVLRNNIPMEICLTSNLTSGATTLDAASHHFPYWYRRKHPIIICTDDKGIFSTTLTREYVRIGQLFDVDKLQLFQLSRSALDLAFAKDCTGHIAHHWDDFYKKRFTDET